MPGEQRRRRQGDLGIGAAGVLGGIGLTLGSGFLHNRSIRSFMKFDKPTAGLPDKNVSRLWEEALKTHGKIERLSDEPLRKHMGKRTTLPIAHGPRVKITSRIRPGLYLGKSRDLPPNIVQIAHGKPWSPKFSFVLVEPAGGISGSALLHEIGHSVFATRHPIFHRLATLSRMAKAKGLDTIPSLVAGLVAARQDASVPVAVGSVLGAAALTSGPLLLDEYMASRWAKKMGPDFLKRFGLGHMQFSRRALNRAFLTYLAAPLKATGIGLGAWGLSKVLKRVLTGHRD